MNAIAQGNWLDPSYAWPRQQHSDAASAMLGKSPAMQNLLRVLQRAARSSMTVLITGETGTGKELAARALHANSPRAGKPFIAINTAALPKDLLESELFGHEAGAFTGAVGRRPGRFKQADGGTLFLDEIGDMPLELQTSLLRVLAGGEFYPVGGHTPVRVDVRVIAATHQNLEQRVAEGRFREDLYHRLNVIRLHIPPLRERHADIPLLLEHYLRQAAASLNEPVKRLTPEAREFLAAFHWPGNIRQLENVCQWLGLMVSAQDIRLDDLPDDLSQPAMPGEPAQWHEALLRWTETQLKAGKDDVAKDAQIVFETVLIRTALEHCAGQRYLAARRLGYGRNTLTLKIKKLKLPC